MTIKVLFFARCVDIVGSRHVELSVAAGTNVAGVVELLVEQHPGLRPLSEIASVAVNAEYCNPETTLQDGDELAIIPPVSGG